MTLANLQYVFIITLQNLLQKHLFLLSIFNIFKALCIAKTAQSSKKILPVFVAVIYHHHCHHKSSANTSLQEEFYISHL